MPRMRIVGAAVLGIFAAVALSLACGLLSREHSGSLSLLREATSLPKPGAQPGAWQDLTIDAGRGPTAWAGQHDEGGQLDESHRLRGRLETAERELEEAQRQLRRADEVGAAGSGVHVVEERGPEIKFAKTLVSNGEVVRVEWSGMAQVSQLDFIALYDKPDAENHDFLELHNVTECSTWQTGKGSINVHLYNHRTEGYSLRYFRKGKFPNDRALFVSTDSNLGSMVFCPSRHCSGELVYFLVAASPVTAHFPVHEPTQIRLSLTGKPTEMTVLWVSDPCPGKPLGGAQVIYGDVSCKDHPARTCRYSHVGSSPLHRTYTAEDMCGAPASVAGARGFIDTGYIYKSTMQGLEPGKRYFYRVGCQDAPSGWHSDFPSADTHGLGIHDSEPWGFAAGSMMSEEMSFVAAPWTKRDAAVTFVAYADSGITTHQGDAHTTFGAPERVSAAIAKEVAQGKIGMVVHMGDLSYAVGRGFMWEQWGALTQPIASAVPYMVTVGNHEYTHLPSLVVELISPAAAEGARYSALPAAFGPRLVAWHTDAALKGQVVRAGGNFFKGENLTDDFCRKALPYAEQLVQGRLLYENKLVLVEAGKCGYARKVKLAELFGAAGVILFDQDALVPKWAAVPHFPTVDPLKPKWTDNVGIPCVYLTRSHGLDLLRWVDDHSAWRQDVQVVVRSSTELQVNDPSLAALMRTETSEGGEGAKEKAYESGVDGYHPKWGNFGDDSGGECGVPFSQRFDMPQTFGGNGNFWYSFEYGPVRFVVLSTEHAIGRGSQQYAWLERTFAGTDRDVSPWLVVLMHRSIYGRTESTAEQRVSTHLQKQLEPLFRKHKVNLVLSGHEHRYLRTAPVYMDLNMATITSVLDRENEVMDLGWGATYAVVGTGGAQLQYRAKDAVHDHFYCVGGKFPMRRCKACARDANGKWPKGSNQYVCRDKNACCEYTLDANGVGSFANCGFCEHINATGPGPRGPTSRAGPRNPQRWGWQRTMMSDFGFLRVHASELEMKLEFVQTLNVFHTPVVDKHGRSLHLPADVSDGCKESCTKDMLPDGRVMDSLVLKRRHDGSLHAEDAVLQEPFKDEVIALVDQAG